MEVKTGSKQTDVGTIPEDWDARELAEIFSISAGGDLVTESFSPVPDEEHCYPVYCNALNNRGVYGYSKQRRYDGESVTVTARGTIGVAHRRVGKFDAIGRVLVMRPTVELSCGFVSEYLNQRVEFAIESTGVPQLTAPQIARYKVAFPPFSEQTAIAAALSDADVLISSLEKLIAKKRAIKEGAMQLLLTGRRRLPGFTGEWEALSMANNAVIKARIGWQGLTTAEYRETGDYCLVTGTEFKNGHVDWSDCWFVEEKRYIQDTNIQLEAGDVLLTKDGSIGKVAYVDSLPGPATLNSGVFVIRPINDDFNPLYLFFVLSSNVFTEFLSKLQAGSTISHLYQKDFVSFSFVAPPINEQIVIAEVYSDMDAEIEALENKLAKYRLIKQGMMQELLTGKKRLA